MEVYEKLFDTALSQYNVDLLVKLWRDSLLLDKTSLKELNTNILNSLPTLREELGMPQVEKESFPEFVRDYDEYMYSVLCNNTPNNCFLFFIKKKTLGMSRKP